MDKFKVKLNNLKQEGTIQDIPQKLFYKIGEVSRITSLEPYVLRYWETEFPFLKPKKGKSKQRLYQRKDIEVLFEIKTLLYEERLTIEGVRKRLAKRYIDVVKPETKDVESANTGKGNPLAKEKITRVKSKLNNLLDMLK